jgi:WD40 repeat protein
LRRLISAGSDGSCRMWNFSNGQCLTELKIKSTGKKVDSEITALTCVFDPEDEKHEKTASIIAVGWDKKVFIWEDEKEEDVLTDKILPKNE